MCLLITVITGNTWIPLIKLICVNLAGKQGESEPRITELTGEGGRVGEGDRGEGRRRREERRKVKKEEVNK